MKTFSLKSAFILNLFTILFFGMNAIIFDLTVFYAVAFVFLMILPVCSTKR